MGALIVGTVAHASTTTFVCDYPKYSDETGLHRAEQDLRLTFIVDAPAKKAYMLGKSGATEVRIISTDGGLTLVEITDAGNVMATAIDRHRKSVHSRQGMLLGAVIPSQYYGTCKVM